MARVTRLIVAVSMVVLGIAVLGTSARAASASVSIADFAFSPSSVTVGVGDTVTWTNDGPSSHTVTADGGAFGSGALGTGATFAYTATTPGTFAYHCSFHPSMTGTVVVTGSATTTTTTTTTTAPTTAAPTPGAAVTTTTEVLDSTATTAATAAAAATGTEPALAKTGRRTDGEALAGGALVLGGVLVLVAAARARPGRGAHRER